MSSESARNRSELSSEMHDASSWCVHASLAPESAILSIYSEVHVKLTAGCFQCEFDKLVMKAGAIENEIIAC